MSDRESTNKQYKRFRDKVTSKLVGCEAGVAFFLKKDMIDQVVYDPSDKSNEIFYSLATNPEIYAIFKLAVLLTENVKGDEIFEETVKKYKLKANGVSTDK